MTTREQWAAKRAEFDALRAKIAAMPQGAVRVELKRRANNLSAEIVVLRQKCIQEELAKPDPQFVPRESLGMPEPQPQEEEETSE